MFLLVVTLAIIGVSMAQKTNEEKAIEQVRDLDLGQIGVKLISLLSNWKDENFSKDMADLLYTQGDQLKSLLTGSNGASLLSVVSNPLVGKDFLSVLKKNAAPLLALFNQGDVGASLLGALNGGGARDLIGMLGDGDQASALIKLVSQHGTKVLSMLTANNGAMFGMLRQFGAPLLNQLQGADAGEIVSKLTTLQQNAGGVMQVVTMVQDYIPAPLLKMINGYIFPTEQGKSDL